ncbi:MAG: hypothetical protein HAW59_00710 [Betaproteobacteria bacterium]|nr:hypothetical protein [Betaproteobacteria bacterium]
MSYGVYGFQDAWGWTFVIIGIAIMRFKNMAKVILCGGLLLLIIAVFSVNDTPHTLSGGTASTPAPAIKPSDPDEFRVPSDPKAIYKLVLVKPTQGVLLVVSARKGPSGKSLAAREMHCKQKKFRYVGEGDDLQQLLKNIRDTDPMSPLVEGSISWHIAQRACKKAV